MCKNPFKAINQAGKNAKYSTDISNEFALMSLAETDKNFGKPA
jgi:hypothetical protein